MSSGNDKSEGVLERAGFHLVRNEEPGESEISNKFILNLSVS